MKNKIKIGTGILVAILILPVFVFAQTSNPNQDGRKQAQTGSVDQSKQERIQVKVTNLRRLMQNQINLADRAIKRMSAIMEKIQTVRASLAAQGADLDAADVLIEKAKAQKLEAEQLLSAAKASQSATTVDSLEPRKSVQKFMSDARALKNKLTELHKTLKQAAKALRAAEKAVKETTNEEETE